MPLTLLPAILVAFLLSLALNRLMIAVASKLGLMDHPDERRVHSTPIPRAGGLAIWLAFLGVTYSCEYFVPSLHSLLPKQTMDAFALASLVLVAVGVIDDRHGMPAKWKLLGHIAAAALFYALRPNGTGNISGFVIPGWLDALIFVGWAVVLINAYNLIDGLDGLCGGLALIAMVVLGAMSLMNDHTGEAILLFLMAAAIAGFLRYNLNPARIFLGDAGSMMLGLFIAAASTQAVGRRAVLGTLLLPVAVAGVPLLDVLLAIWRRSARNLTNRWNGGVKVGVFSPDKDHLHHRFLDSGMNQRRVALTMQAAAVALSILAFLPMLLGNKVIGLAVVALLVVALQGLRQFASIELVQTGSILHLAVNRPQSHRHLRLATYFYDTSMLVAAAITGMIIETNFWFRSYSTQQVIQFVTLFVITGTVAIRMANTYRRIWTRATLRDLAILIGWLGVSGILTMTLTVYAERELAWNILRVGLLATAFAAAFIALPRCGPEMLRELAIDARHRRFGKNTESSRQVLIYGAGDLGNLFTEYLKYSPPENFREFRVVGFLDDCPMFKGRVIRGFPVLGTLDDLEYLKAHYPIQGIIIAISQLPPESKEKLQRLADAHHLTLYDWGFDLTPQPFS